MDTRAIEATGRIVLSPNSAQDHAFRARVPYLNSNIQVSATASCLCLLPGYDGAHIVYPLAWPTQPLGFPASPQRAGRWSPWTPEKGR